MILELLPFKLSICRLPAGSPLPAWARASRLLQQFQGEEETSVLCESSCVPEGVTEEPGWCGLKVAGTQAFTLTGVLSSILTPLAEAGVSILAFSTYDTDYVLVKLDRLEDALASLPAGIEIIYKESRLPVTLPMETPEKREP